MRVLKNACTVSFTGKVHVYSDFDGTYCPEKHSEMHNPSVNPHMQKYCTKMTDFFNSAGDDISFHITTGRTLGEFEAVSWLLKMRNYRLPLPHSVITKNGSDEFIKNGSDSDFYDKGIFPYNKNNFSLKKEEKIKTLTGWNGNKIKDYVKQAAEKVCLRFIEADSENSVKDYGNMSLFSEGKLNPNEWKRLPNDGFKIYKHENPIADFVIGSRNDGKLKINIIFPPDYDYCPFRTWVYDSYVNDIKNYLQKNNVNYFHSWEAPDYKNHYRKSLTITPKINGGRLTKLFDTKEAVKDAIKNNDLVIVAGDGSNDFEMLNPLEYISDEEWHNYAQGSNCREFYNEDAKHKLNDLKRIYNGNSSEYINELRQELTKNGLLEKINKMPLTGIVIKKENSKLQPLVDTFSQTGKIIEADKGNIDKAISQAIRNYANKNKRFREDMSENLKVLINNNL